MRKEILLSGLLGGLVMLVWLIVSLAILQVSGDTAIRPLPDQVEVHAALKERITEPGTYACLYVSSEQEANQFPNYRDEPLFEIKYQGYTHNTVPGLLTPWVLAFLLAPMAAAWLLSMASEGVLSKYSRRVLFVGGLGLFLVFSGGWPQALAGEESTNQVLLASLNSVITWILVGLVVAWRIKPQKT